MTARRRKGPGRTTPKGTKSQPKKGPAKSREGPDHSPGRRDRSSTRPGGGREFVSRPISHNRGNR